MFDHKNPSAVITAHTALVPANYKTVVMFQALAGSDFGELSFGSTINASALLIILLHQVLESHTLVRHTQALKAGV